MLPWQGKGCLPSLKRVQCEYRRVTQAFSGLEAVKFRSKIVSTSWAERELHQVQRKAPLIIARTYLTTVSTSRVKV